MKHSPAKMEPVVGVNLYVCPTCRRVISGLEAARASERRTCAGVDGPHLIRPVTHG